jgi:diguanylate cyclase (GGDEF)-like protein
MPGALERLLAVISSVRNEPAAEVLRILVIEDDAVLSLSLSARLAGPHREVLLASSVSDATRVLVKEDVSLILLNLLLPDIDGRNLLLRLRADPRTADLPIFVISGKIGPLPKTECFALGADAFFEKPLDLAALAAAVNARLDRSAEAARECRRDVLTGLPNRTALLERFERAQTATARASGPVAIAALELDHFQWIDDTYGTQAADAVIRRVGVRISVALRQWGFFARLEGAQFVALFAGLGAAEAGKALEQALGVLRRVDFRPGEAAPLQVTFSAGVAEVPEAATLEDALVIADRARYQARTAGRNRIQVAKLGGIAPPRRILFAEDDPSIVRMVGSHLRREGFEVVHFSDGAAALEAAPEVSPALVITDIEMPNLDGLGLLRGLREHAATRHVPVMMLTAMGDENYVVRAFELGADDYVLKPFSLREVVARVRALLRRPSVAGVPLVA